MIEKTKITEKERMFRYIKRNLNKDMEIMTLPDMFDIYRKVEIEILDSSNKKIPNISKTKTFSPIRPLEPQEVLNFILEEFKKKGYYLINKKYLILSKYSIYSCEYMLVNFCKNHQYLKNLILLNLVFEDILNFDERHKEEIKEIEDCKDCKIVKVYYYDGYSDEDFSIDIYHISKQNDRN